MPRNDSDSVVTQCLIDRLIDKDPQVRNDQPLARSQSVKQLKLSLKRDLEWLLNSRRIAEPAPESFAEVSRSLYHFGLPDFSALSVESPRDRNSLLREIEAAVAAFEPRLQSVRVTLVDSPSKLIRAVRFQIEGMLMMDPAPEQISFDTVLQLGNGEFQIKGERSA